MANPIPGRDAVNNGNGTATTYYDDGSTVTWRINGGDAVSWTPPYGYGTDPGTNPGDGGWASGQTGGDNTGNPGNLSIDVSTGQLFQGGRVWEPLPRFNPGQGEAGDGFWGDVMRDNGYGGLPDDAVDIVPDRNEVRYKVWEPETQQYIQRSVRPSQLGQANEWDDNTGLRKGQYSDPNTGRALQPGQTGVDHTGRAVVMPASQAIEPVAPQAPQQEGAPAMTGEPAQHSQGTWDIAHMQQANDGQTFGSLQQSDPNAYNTFLAHYGDPVVAANQWVSQHNASLVAAAPPPPTAPTTVGIEPWQQPDQPRPQPAAPPPVAGSAGPVMPVGGVGAGAPGYGIDPGTGSGSPNAGNPARGIPPGPGYGGPGQTPPGQVAAPWQSGQGTNPVPGQPMPPLNTSPTNPMTPPAASVTTNIQAPDPTGGANRIGGGPNSGTVHTLFGDVNGEFGLPGNMGLNWWTLFGNIMKSLSDETGTVYNPLTGQPLTHADGSLQKTLNAIAQEANIRQKDEEIKQAQQRIDDARRAGDLDRAQREAEYARTLTLQRDTLAQNQKQFESELGFKVGSALGVLDGKMTLDAQKFAADERDKAFARAADPGRAFENELARNAPISAAASLSPAVNVTPANAQPGMVYATGALPAFASLVPTPDQLSTTQVRVPAVVNAVRQGSIVPTAGAFGTNTVAPASQAALTDADFRKANQRTLAGLNPLQKQIIGSYGKAGSVSPEMQDWYAQKGKPKDGSVTAGYSLN